jgi:hypothetical protein
VSDVSTGDLRAQAEQFMALLDDLRVEGTPDAIAMRQELVDIVDQFGAAADKEAAKQMLLARLMLVESKVTLMIARPVRAMRDRLFKELKRIGKHSQAGKTMTTMFEALGTLLDALDALMRAIEGHDPEERDRAHALLANVQTRLKSLKTR